ncbi:hypothetical protein DKG77_01160 [Flagellimonas aquimarina]|uniref:DUF3108 domain-containing protein n=1 Tax=Flagellimonas aquimarina TaxID=2201895 RepID=A0A316L0P6_9FLAO|nr:hypothetical protein [Allomuricauda koreensis]PWL39476.1 hypothetical protein DKG77_01160 [Allomuricauda koreensis]
MFLVLKGFFHKEVNRSWVWLLVLAVLYSCSKNEQSENIPLYQKILPGSKELEIVKKDLHSNKYSKPWGTMVYGLEEIFIDNNKYWQLNIDFMVNGKASPDTVYFDAKTLAFYKKSFKNAFSEYTGNLKFENNKLIGKLAPYTEDSQLKTPLLYDRVFPHEVFEPAMLNYLLGVLPLKKGYKVSLPMLDLNNGSSIIWANVEVLGKENVRIKGKKYETWKVLSRGSREKTFWIDTEKKAMIKMENKGVWFQWKLNES